MYPSIPGEGKSSEEFPVGELEIADKYIDEDNVSVTLVQRHQYTKETPKTAFVITCKEYANTDSDSGMTDGHGVYLSAASATILMEWLQKNIPILAALEVDSLLKGES